MSTPNIENLIDQLECDLYDWNTYVEVDTAPCPLNRYIEPALLNIKHALQTQAARIKELDADRETALAPLQIALDEVSRLRAQLAEIEKREPVAWAISYDGVTPYTLWCEGDGALLDCEVKRQGGTTRKMPLFTRPIPAQIIGLQDVHDAVTADPTLADCAQNVMELVEALEKLARLGNGEHYGNSDGNMIARTALEQPIIQNQIVKDISRKPCHACAHYEQGKRTGVSIYDETCYICREYYANKWEAA